MQATFTTNQDGTHTITTIAGSSYHSKPFETQSAFCTRVSKMVYDDCFEELELSYPALTITSEDGTFAYEDYSGFQSIESLMLHKAIMELYLSKGMSDRQAQEAFSQINL